MASQHPYFLQMQQVLSLTREMLQYAEEDQWDQLALADEKRQHLLANVSELPSAESDVSQSADLVAELLEMNNKLVEFGKEKLEQYSSEQRNVNQGRKAVAAYGG